MKKEYLIKITEANKFMRLLIIPIVLISMLPFGCIWGTDHLKLFITNFYTTESLFYGIALIFSIALHELIHGITWCYFTQNGWNSIKFGILWNSLTPYCHCKEPLTAHQYRMGLLMPTIVLGIIPTITAWIFGSVFLLVYGIIMIISGAGDLMIYRLIVKIRGNTKIKDHPTEIGVIIESD